MSKLYPAKLFVHAVFCQAGPFGESADGVTVRVGVAEEDFERAFGFGHLVCPAKMG